MMTDRQKLSAVFNVFGCDTLPTTKAITGGGRRFYFNEAGEIDRIVDYCDGHTYKEHDITRRGAK
ncbi:unnamed protein product [marine sediment metagenome]|uniref:Uncharacterized protein n=1 Tax=marine sediment metagenome TaxID=412755 RepID=X0RY19_9ZZZZ